KSMLSAGQIVLSYFDVHSELEEEDSADPDNDKNGHEQVGAISVGVGRLDITPSEGVKPNDLVSVIPGRITVADIDIFPSAVNIVERNQDGHYHKGDGDKNDQQSPHITEEKVGVETTFLNNFSVAVLESRLDQSEDG